jgi:hypothetical protein
MRTNSCISLYSRVSNNHLLGMSEIRKVKCWASSLKNCKDDITREHYISDGLFSKKSVVVSGFEWCRGKPQKIGLSSAVSKILCSRHNNELSDYDSEAKKITDFLQHNLKENPKMNDILEVNGHKFEKWGLKTFFNLSVLGAVDQITHERWFPTEEFVRYIYENKPVPDGTGLYFIDAKIGSDSYGEFVAWNAVRNKADNDKLIGIKISIRGLEFVFNIYPVVPGDSIEFKDTDSSNPKIMYRPPQVKFESESGGTKIIKLIW